MNTTADKLQGILDSKAAIKSAIEAKGVTVGDAALSQYASKIQAISTGMTEAEENDVNFYDYDGFRVASFTIAQAKALTAEQYAAILPPTHDGLTFQEWNWSLNDIQTYDRQYADIGANYITTDGKTHLSVRVDAGENLYLYFIKDNTITATLDWGDNSAQESISHNEKKNHVYANAGTYDVTISATGTGKWGFNGSYIFPMNVIKIHLGNFSSLPSGKPYCNVSVPNTAYCSVTYVGGTMLVIPRNVSLDSQNFVYQSYANICFPKKVNSYPSVRLLFYITGTRIVLPDTVQNNPILASTVNSCQYISILSLPNQQLDPSNTNGNFFNGNTNIEYIDIVQGWTPNKDLLLSGSTRWRQETLVKFFNKLGTTQNTITLTFGSTNLNKLTADQKRLRQTKVTL